MNGWTKTLVCLCLCGLLTQVWAQADEDSVAEEDAAGEEAQEPDQEESEDGIVMPNTGSIYIPMKPAFVVNYGGSGRLKYIKADISLRLQDSKAANSVRHHMPYIRNNLVMLFASQTDESIASQEGKEALRQEALQEVRNVLEQEDRQGGVVDLFFNSFLIQK